MPRVILLAAIAFLAWYGWRRFWALAADQRQRALWRWAPIAVLGVALILVVSGRLHWLGAAIAAAVPLLKFGLSALFRALPLLGMWQQKNGPSRLKTAGLEVVFNVASGDMKGQVLTGPYRGEPLERLTKSQLQEQFDYFQRHDRQSALLLRAYLLRRGFTADRTEPGGADDSALNDGQMTDQQARQVLGIKPDASREEITLAHKRLIQKLHPDRGGNDYLAAIINAAKDQLLG